MVSAPRTQYCYVIILMRLVTDLPGVESGVDSYCRDFGESLLKTATRPDFLLMKII